MAEYNLQQNTIYTVSNEWLDVPEDTAALTDLDGYGNVYDLHQAMVRDSTGELKALIQEFVDASETAVRNVLMEKILFKWTVSDGIGPSSRGPNFDARRLAVIEKFFGQSLAWAIGSNLTNEACSALNETYREIFEMKYAGLMAQTHLKDLYDKITYIWDDDKQQFNTDMSGVIAEIQANLVNDPEEGKQLLSEFARTLRGAGMDRAHCLSCRELFVEMDPSLGWIIDTGGLSVIDHVGQGIWPSSAHMMGTDGSEAIRGSLTEGDGCVNGQYGNDVIYGTDRNETLISMDGDSLLFGGGGADQVYAGAGNDMLDGGTGNDTLYGEAGNDTYIFRRGSGQDTIIDVDSTEGNTDIIWLGGNLTADDVLLRRAGDNLVLKIKDSTDTLTVKDYFRDNSTLNKIEQIVFMDGTIWGDSDILQKTFLATEADDILYRGAENNSIYGRGNGNDTYLFGGPQSFLIGLL